MDTAPPNRSSAAPSPPLPLSRGNELIDAACSTFVDKDKRDGQSNYYGGRRLPNVLQPCLYPLLTVLSGAPYSIPGVCAKRNMSLVVSFYPSERGARKLKAQLPFISKSRDSRCNVALVDPNFNIQLNPTNWSVRHVPICWPDDAERSAHLIKSALPMLLPSTPYVWYGDSKCKSNVAPFEWLGPLLQPRWMHHGPPRWMHHGKGRTDSASQAFPHRNQSPPDILVVKHIGQDHTTMEEVEGTIKHLRRRGSSGLGNHGRRVPGTVREKLRHAVHDVFLHRRWYETVNYKTDVVESGPPDCMCLVWHNTDAAWKFSCRWSMEVAILSMREQVSFHHAQPAGLKVQWTTFPNEYLIGVLRR